MRAGEIEAEAAAGCVALLLVGDGCSRGDLRSIVP
jgi:hypothetical protein